MVEIATYALFAFGAGLAVDTIADSIVPNRDRIWSLLTVGVQ